MKVLHVITGLAAGGAEQQLRLLLRHHTHAAEVAVLTNPGSVAQAIRAEGTQVHEVGMRGNTDLAALPRLVRIMRAGRFDIVHTHLYRAAMYGRVAARLAGVRHVVATEHSLGDRFIEGRLAGPRVRALYVAAEHLGDVTIAVSATVARRLRRWGIPDSRIQVIPNGIEVGEHRFDPQRRAVLRERLGIPADRFVAGAVGRLVPGKRIDLILRAASEQKGLCLLVVGEGPQRAELAQLAAQHGVDAIFTGESADVRGLMSAMDVLVSPSSEETFGLAVVEALAVGLPVYYTSCPAVDDLPAGTVPGVRRLPEDARAYRTALAEAERSGPHRLPPPAALDHFDIARTSARTEGVYAQITGTRTATGHGNGARGGKRT